MAQLAAPQRAVGYAAMRIVARELAVFHQEITGMIAADQTPVIAVHDVIGLLAAGDGDVRSHAEAQIVGAHGIDHAADVNEPIGLMTGEQTVVNLDKGTLRNRNKAGVGRAVIELSGDIMLELAQLHVRAGDFDVAGVVVVFRFALIGNGGKFAAPDNQLILRNRIGNEPGDLVKLERNRRNQRAVRANDKVVRTGYAALIDAAPDIIPVIVVIDHHM